MCLLYESRVKLCLKSKSALSILARFAAGLRPSMSLSSEALSLSESVLVSGDETESDSLLECHSNSEPEPEATVV